MDLSKLLNPQRLCVVGASEKEGFGGDTCRNIMQYMDPERVYFVNPKRQQVFGRPCYASIAEVPEAFDLVVVCTPRNTVPEIITQAAARGARGAVVYASGYAETGSEVGKAAEKELAELCQRLDVALMGPNCAGFVNYTGGVHAFAFLSAQRERRGAVGVVSQSGQLCLSMMDSPQMKFSYIISAGNASLVSTEDYLDYLVHDPSTRVVAMYLEGVKNARRFIQALEAAARQRKPVVVLKTGRSEKGSRLAASHTGSLAGADRVYEAIFQKYGVIRVQDLEELMATALLLATLPTYPTRPTFAALNLSGGETGICADLAQLNGIELPDFQPATREQLRQILPYYATPDNPLDMTASLSYDASAYAKALETVMQDPNIGMLLLGYTLLEEISDPAIHYMYEGIEKVVRRGQVKPLAMIPFAGNTRHPGYCEKLHQLGVPILPPAAYAFRILRYLSDFIGYDPVIRLAEQPALTEKFSQHTRPWSEWRSKQLLQAYGITVPREGIARTPEEAVNLARELGYPVAVKISCAQITHKSDAGGVVLNVQDDDGVRKAFDHIMSAMGQHYPHLEPEGVLVSKMQKPGLEVIIGIKNDPQFGPCILCGLGGVFVEVFRDTVLYPAPVCLPEALTMLQTLRAAPLLQGYRGGPALDQEALAQAIVNISRLASDHRHVIKEMDINPLFVYEKGICAVDALVLEFAD
ncbi:MAG: acetate--CoA ligase family protein [Desulfurispora sp.]|uniref:acetate--CoA ligase family protein n=1 Tax=Desulfurispora sp. TaxID=3014275 RepID=UPI0040498E32